MYRRLVIGFTSWFSAVFFGLVLMDIFYAASLSGMANALDRRVIFSGISDMLLRFGIILFASLVASMIASWGRIRSRHFFVAAIFFLMLEFIGPAVLPFAGPGVPSWIRIFPSGLASVFTFLGMAEYSKRH